MTATVVRVSPDWLALREPADAAARSGALVQRVARHLTAGPLVIHDLGGGSGAMGRWLAPRLPGPQHWVVHDLDADLLVLASRAETFGMVVTEALARGVPVLAADVGGVTEALGRGEDGTRPGLLVAPGDPAALATALRTWLGDADLRGRLRRAARERRASLHGWPATTSVVAGVLTGAAR